jgi:hypothetical protein
MSFFALRNLSSSETSPCTPWVFSSAPPAEVCGKENKTARDRWINLPTTEWQVYSAFEGINPGVRISEAKVGAEEGNPPFRLHAFVADIDCAVSRDELAAGIARISISPNYYERTMSGNARLVWLFEKPVTFPNRRFAVEFLKLALARLKPDLVAAGFDRPAWEEPNRYYTNSGEWLMINADERVPADLLNGWVVDVADKHIWRKDRGAVDLPLPVVYAELIKKWPAMNWPGDFVEDSAGPSFWLEGSTSPKSAKVKPTGMFTFSAHQNKPFYSWTELLGKDFVERHATELMGKAVEGIYHDGNKYFRKDGHGQWKVFMKEDVVLHLTTDRGLSTVKDGGVPSEANRAISYIHNWQGIDGAAPFVFQPSGIIRRSNGVFLNTFTKKSLRPADEPAVWGPHGNFPFLSHHFSTMFHADSQPNNPLDFWLSWLSRFYRGTQEHNLESGQSVFFLGGVGIGKTFLSQGLLPHLCGGGVSAEAYLMGQSEFNSELFENALWTIDDNSANVDAVTHRKFSSILKKMTANTTFQYHAKYRIPCTVDWLGRVLITANADELSARIVPNLGLSILDKIMLFRGAVRPESNFPDRASCIKIIRQEAPFLARFLLDYTIPDHCLGSSRFGVKSYHEVELLKTADQSSEVSGFREQIELWREMYFSDKPDLPEWRGTAFQLLMRFKQDSSFASALGNIDSAIISRKLMALKDSGVPYLDSHGGNATREWVVYRDDTPPPPPAPVKQQLKNSQFNKTA